MTDTATLINMEPIASAAINASQTSTFDVPIGNQILSVDLLLSGTVASSDLTQIRVLVNGAVIMDLTGTQLDALNQLDGMPAQSVNRVLCIPFQRFRLKQRESELLTGLVTSSRPAVGRINLSSVRVEVTRNATTGTVTPYYRYTNNPSNRKGPDGKELTGFDTVQNPAARLDPTRPRNWHKMWRKQTFNVAAAGQFTFPSTSLFPVQLSNNNLYRITLFPSTGTVTEVDMSAANRQIVKHPLALLNQWRTAAGDKTSVANTFVVYDTTSEGYGFTWLPVATLQDLNLRVTFSAINNVDVVSEYIGTIPA